jgi:hypothetical protein
VNVVYLIGSLAGIALLVGLNVLLLGRARAGVGSAATIAERLSREIAGFHPGACVIAADGRAALIENAANQAVILVRAMGDGVVARNLAREAFGGVTRDGACLSLRLADFTLPRANIALDDEALAREWEARLKA